MSGFEDLLDELVPGSGRATGPSIDAPHLPKDLGLELIGEIGRGAVGTVFRARDPVLDRVVAVKVAHDSAAARASLLQEAQLTSRLTHPAVLPVHRVVARDGLLCVEYRLAPEQTLEKLWSRWTQAPDEAWSHEKRLALVYGLCGAVASAHAKNVVHGDIHPANIGVSEDGAPYVLDWSGVPDTEGLSGHPGYAAPELLRGDRAKPEADVYALAAVAWELLTLRRLRPRHSHEPLGAYIRRWREATPERPSRHVAVDPAIDEWVVLGLEPGRPSATAYGEELMRILTGRADRARRAAESARLLNESRDGLMRLRELSRRREAERRAASVLISKVPGHAPITQKRPGWSAEDRATALEIEEESAWIEATETATLASTLIDDSDAPPLLAELWWERMRIAEEQHEPILATVSAERVRFWDRNGPYTRRLDAPGRLTLRADADGAVATIERYVERDRRLVPQVVAESLPFPLNHELAPGSYRVRIDAPGRRTTHWPVLIDRGSQHSGDVRLYSDAEIGEGYVHVPGGSFRMGGDPKARQPLEPCEPHVPDLFVKRTMVTSLEYLAFLNANPELAADHAPGEAGFFGGGATYWARDASGEWKLPPGWDPMWPAFSLHMGDILAYCAWRSEVEGRVVRLPTEEEWEKAARGVDGRSYPWGPGFDPTYAHMRRSRPGAPRPWRVDDYPVDESVYGVVDMAGGMREWTSSLYDEGQIVIRGGTWGDDAEDCRCACRSGIQSDFRYSFVAFRTVAEPQR
ncbi:MAG: hypothetical protein EP330_08065 [Deltaproteobacteria bacterium]|nr:MAG: hypothetical protein EP330_08065 [Deltaproteobacteria bacterium]